MITTFSSESSAESDGSDAIETLPSRRYPQRTRTPRHVDGTIPWSDIPDIWEKGGYVGMLRVRMC